MSASIYNQPQSLSDSLNDSTDTQSVQGAEEANPLLYEFPQNQSDLQAYKQSISDRIEKNNIVLKKNINLQLCYVYLMLSDYVAVIRTGNHIIRNLSPNARTKFQAMQYLAEAHCMLGQGKEALDCLKTCDQGLDPEAKFKFDNLSNNL